MKYLLVLILSLSLLSCNIEKPDYPELHTANNFPQKWELVQMHFPSQNKLQKGLNMAWQESYLLLPDSTFLKKRMTTTETITAEGKFYTEKQNGETYLRFEFNKEGNIINTNDFVTDERLLISTENKKMTLVSSFQGEKQILNYKLK